MSSAVARSRVRLAQVLLLLIVVGGTVHVADTVVGGGLFTSPYHLTVRLDEAGGLHPRSTVTYRGQRIGLVTEVRITPRGVEAVVEIDEEVQIPRDSTFHVRNLSAVGEQHLYVEPRSDAGPMLTDGDVVRARDTTTPMPMPQVLADAQALMRRIDTDDIATIADELDDAFGDGALDLRGASVELEEAFGLLQEMQPDLVRLTRRGRVPLETLANRADEVRRTTRNAELVSEELAAVTPALASLLRNASRVSHRALRLWSDLEPRVTDLLATAAPVVAMAGSRVPGLQHWLRWLPGQLGAMAGSTRDGSGRVLLVPKVLKNCRYDVERRSVHDLRRRPVDTSVRCDDSVPHTQGRGAVNVPRPGPR